MGSGLLCSREEEDGVMGSPGERRLIAPLLGFGELPPDFSSLVLAFSLFLFLPTLSVGT